MTAPQTCKILVAEDDKFLSRAYEFKLKHIGCDMILARDGEDAIQKIRSEKPDLVLLDLMMPKRTGFDVLNEMKGDPATKDIPVIVMSNLGQESDIKKGMESGALDYIVKANTSLEDVVERIEKMLNTKLQARGITMGQTDAKGSVCADCKAALPAGAKFCPGCGKKV